jgi:hypothetical protein
VFVGSYDILGSCSSFERRVGLLPLPRAMRRSRHSSTGMLLQDIQDEKSAIRQRPSRPLRCLGILASTPHWTLNAGTHFFAASFKSKFFASSKSAASSLRFDNFSQDILLLHLSLPQSSEGFLSVSAIQASHLSRETCQWDLRTRVTVSLRSSRPQVLLVFHLSATTSPLSHLVGSYDHLLSKHLISGY